MTTPIRPLTSSSATIDGPMAFDIVNEGADSTSLPSEVAARLDCPRLRNRWEQLDQADRAIEMDLHDIRH